MTKYGEGNGKSLTKKHETCSANTFKLKLPIAMLPSASSTDPIDVRGVQQFKEIGCMEDLLGLVQHGPHRCAWRPAVQGENAVEDKLKTMQLSMYRDRQSGTLSAVTRES